MQSHHSDHRAHHDDADRHAHTKSGVPVILAVLVAIVVIAGLVALRALDPAMR